MSVADVLKPAYLKKNKIAYTFSNMSSKLLDKYPCNVRACYQLHDRSRGMISLRLRRSFFVNAKDKATHDGMKRRYHDYWYNHNLRAYLDLIREVPMSERKFFRIPPKVAPNVLLPMSSPVMNSINDEFWDTGDRQHVVEHMQNNIPETQIMTDFTFQVCTLADESNACLVITNERQQVCFIGMAPKGKRRGRSSVCFCCL